jgi:HlyD family secretion protein
MKTILYVSKKRILIYGFVVFCLLVAMLIEGSKLKVSGAASSSHSANIGSLVSAESNVGYVAGMSLDPGQAAVAYTFMGDIRTREQVVMASKVPARLKKIHGEVGDLVRKGDLVVELDHEVQDAQVKQAEAALSQAEAQFSRVRAGSRKEQIAIAQANLNSAQAQLDMLLEGARKEQIAAAQSALKAAQAQLELLLAGPTAEQLTIAELQARIAEYGDVLREKRSAATINSAGVKSGMIVYSPEMMWFEEIISRLQVELAQTQLKATKSPPRSQQVAQLEAAVEAARAQLELLTAPPRPQQVEQLRSAVEVAKQQLELVRSPYTDYDLESAAAGVAQARAALEIARAQLEETLLVAPFDGVIASRSLSPGALAMPGVPIATFISTELEAVFHVSEAEFPQVKIGQPVSITVAAYPGKVVAGQIRVIAPLADSQTRSFEVYVSLSDPEGRLRPGMFATISLQP